MGASWGLGRPAHFVSKTNVFPTLRGNIFKKMHHSRLFIDFCRGVPGVKSQESTSVSRGAGHGLLQKGHIVKCFKNEILLYQITFPRRKTSAVITASISSAPSAKITNALPFKSAILDEQRYLVSRPLISQPFPKLSKIQLFCAAGMRKTRKTWRETLFFLKLKGIF